MSKASAIINSTVNIITNVAQKTTFDLILGKITLEEGSWVGAQSIVCPNVTLKSHAILAVGSIANKDLEAYSIYQGNPGIKVRERKIES